MKKLIASLLLALAVSSHGQAPTPVGAEEATAAITRLRDGLVTTFKIGDI
jgi:hypothetical protein